MRTPKDRKDGLLEGVTEEDTAGSNSAYSPQVSDLRTAT